MADYSVSQAPGFSAAPDCARFAVEQAVIALSYPLCQRKAAASVFISCICASQYPLIVSYISGLVSTYYTQCGGPQIASATSIMSAYCSVNAAGQLFTTVSVPNFSSSTSTPQPGPSVTITSATSTSAAASSQSPTSPFVSSTTSVTFSSTSTTLTTSESASRSTSTSSSSNDNGSGSGLHLGRDLVIVIVVVVFLCIAVAILIALWRYYHYKPVFCFRRRRRRTEAYYVGEFGNGPIPGTGEGDTDLFSRTDRSSYLPMGVYRE